jgi:hypothetical protein
MLKALFFCIDVGATNSPGLESLCQTTQMIHYLPVLGLTLPLP